jgi:hypothetical protein
LRRYYGFTALFDQYRIDEIEVWITPTYQNSSGGNVNSRWLSVIDYDDSNTPGTTGALLQYSNVVDCTANEGCYRRFRPHVGLTTNSAAGTAYSNKLSDWIDSANVTAQHYGIKLAAFQSAVTSTYNLVVRYHFSTRNVF